MVPTPSYVQAHAFQPRPLAGGGAFEWRRSCGPGDFIGIGWKGTRIPAYLAKHLCGFDAAERLWRSRESKIYRRYPPELHPASALKSVMVVAIWLPEKTAYQRVLISHWFSVIFGGGGSMPTISYTSFGFCSDTRVNGCEGSLRPIL